MKLYFIGAGPGDPELLTVKAQKIIKKADIIIYAGSLVNKDILKIARKECVIFDSKNMHLDEVLRIFKKEKTSLKIIARLHTGEPSLYGAIQEQMTWCEKEGINYELIPGISSFQAASSLLKQEWTLPNVSQTLIITRISGRTKVPEKESLERLAKIRATMIIFLSVQEIEKVVGKLKQGYSKDTPVAVLEKISQEGERKILGILNNIAQKVKAAKIKRQALIIVGDVLKKKYQLSKLYDKDFKHMFRK